MEGDARALTTTCCRCYPPCQHEIDVPPYHLDTTQLLEHCNVMNSICVRYHGGIRLSTASHVESVYHIDMELGARRGRLLELGILPPTPWEKYVAGAGREPEPGCHRNSRNPEIPEDSIVVFMPKAESMTTR